MKFHRLPAWFPIAGWSGFGYFGHIWVKDDVPPSVLAHELVHVAQQDRDGWLTFIGRYVFKPSWRVKYEAEAYAVDVRAGLSLDSAAKCIASGTYLWPCSEAQARWEIARWLP